MFASVDMCVCVRVCVFARVGMCVLCVCKDLEAQGIKVFVCLCSYMYVCVFICECSDYNLYVRVCLCA